MHAFFTGLFLMLIVFGMLVATSVIYDSVKQFTVQTYFFQPDNLSENRPGMPAGLNEIGDSRIRDMLIKKFVTEYFYITPDTDDIKRRMRNDSTLSYLSSDSVFNNWKSGQAKQIQEQSEKNVMRSVRIVGDILNTVDESGNGYWVVEYELQTWRRPNKMDEYPAISHGKMYLRIIYEHGLWPDAPLEKVLDNYDPSIAFMFRVTQVEDYPE